MKLSAGRISADLDGRDAVFFAFVSWAAAWSFIAWAVCESHPLVSCAMYAVGLVGTCGAMATVPTCKSGGLKIEHDKIHDKK